MSQQQVKMEIVGYLSTKELEEWRRIMAQANAISTKVNDFSRQEIYQRWVDMYTFVGDMMGRLGYSSDDNWDISAFDGAVRVGSKEANQID